MTTFDGSQSTGSPRLSLYRAIWRWHFYAGLLSIPFLVLLAVTGSLYLFKNEINQTVFAYRSVVADPGRPALEPSALVSRAIAAVPGSTPGSYTDPATRTAPAVVSVKAGGSKHLVYIDPYDGRVLDVLRADREPMYLLKKIHSLELFGTFANRLIEAVAGFALVLVVTGIYLWWPRGQAGGIVSVRGSPRRRVWWRDLHAVTGVLAGGLVFFLAITGLPWSGYWGATLNDYAGRLGIGYPAQVWDDVPLSTLPTQAVIANPGWTMEGAPVPLSEAHSSGTPISLDKAITVARNLGIVQGFEMAIPQDETGVYTAAIYPPDLAQERTIHIDQYSGRPLANIRFADYGPVGKAIEFGINVHQGQQWGLANQLVMLATCICIILLSVSAVTMWWKRRPAGRIGVPPYPVEPRIYRFLWLAAVAIGLAFPITGLAILAMLGFDLLVIRTVPPIRRAFA
ncbi:hypothetical protein LMIY3S_05469 [Labrys miyagiensis]